MHMFNKLLLRLIAVVFLLIGAYSFYDEKYVFQLSSKRNVTNLPAKYVFSTLNNPKTINVWCIFARVRKNVLLKSKFRRFIESLLAHTSVPLSLHVLSDNSSRAIAQSILQFEIKVENKTLEYRFYDIMKAASQISDVVNVMTPHFSSRPGTYYSDSLFYMSLGLDRIAPTDQNYAIMVDCDIKFVSDIAELYKQFERFEPTTLFSLASELTPVYRHVLYAYRLKHKNTTFGDYEHEIPSDAELHAKMNQRVGYPGYNSGVVLFDLQRIRQSKKYPKLVTKQNVQYLVDKYLFKGHLGDQDFYTLMGFEYPELIQQLPCVFNRQLCVWWRDHGYADIFEHYFKCNGDIKIYHGNCNSALPV